MNPRYFIGIALPNDLSHQIETIQKEILKDQAVMQPLVPHITLLHPNILMSLSPMYFVPQVKTLADKKLPISVELTKTGKFDERVLYITVKSHDLMDLHQEMISLLPPDIRARYQVGRSFIPHITIAQAKPLQALGTDLVEQLQQRLIPLLPCSFETTHLTQFNSTGPRTYNPKVI